jgi:hypothetical protein
MRPEPLDKMQARLSDDQARSQQHEIDLRHNRNGDISPFQRQRLEKQSRSLLVMGFIALIAIVGLAIVMLLEVRDHGTAVITSYLMLMLVASIFLIAGFGRWWGIQLDLEDGKVKVVKGKTRITHETRRGPGGESTTRKFFIGSMQLNDSMATGLARMPGLHVCAYVTPRSNIILAVEHDDDAARRTAPLRDDAVR